jgi:hypothetical protein
MVAKTERFSPHKFGRCCRILILKCEEGEEDVFKRSLQIVNCKTFLRASYHGWREGMV